MGGAVSERGRAQSDIRPMTQPTIIYIERNSPPSTGNATPLIAAA